jgi:hypothetical protein
MKKINPSLIQFIVAGYALFAVISTAYGLSALITGTAYAANMNSSNYSIADDSVNFGGTENSTSTSYSLSDTMGEVATGISSSTNYVLGAGYRHLQSSYISISSSPDMALPDITGMGGEDSLGASSWRVITDNVAGYQIMIRADTSPALKDASTGAFFSDYVPMAGANPDYFFGVPADKSYFGFSVEGQDILGRFRDNGSVCNAGSFDTQDRCWDGFSVSDKTIAERSSSNHPLGTITTVKYKVGIGTNKIQESGAYSTNITVTAVTL